MNAPLRNWMFHIQIKECKLRWQNMKRNFGNICKVETNQNGKVEQLICNKSNKLSFQILPPFFQHTSDMFWRYSTGFVLNHMLSIIDFFFTHYHPNQETRFVSHEFTFICLSYANMFSHNLKITMFIKSKHNTRGKINIPCED